MPIENDQGVLLVAYLDFYPGLMDPNMTSFTLDKNPSYEPGTNVRIRVAIPIPKEAFHASYSVDAETRVEPNGGNEEPQKNILA